MQGLKQIRVTRENGGDNSKGEEEHLLSPMARLCHEPGFNIYIIAVIGFKTQINPDVVKANLVHSLLKHPRFSSLQVMDDNKVIKWVPTNVNLNNHIVEPALDKIIDSSDKFVENYTYNLTKTTINKAMPLWDVHILNVKTSDAESTAILRVHHSIGDGLSLMSILLSCSRKVSDPKALPTIPGKKRLESRDSTTISFWEIFSRFLSILMLAWNTIVDVVLHLATAWFLEDTQTHLKGSSRVIGSDISARRIAYRIVNWDDVKFVKNAMDATVNDVLIGVTQAGLSRYLNRKYGTGKNDDEAVERKNYLPKSIRLRGSMPINLRSSPGIHAMDEMMKKGTKAKWGNKIGYILFPFTIAMREDPLDYVRDAKAAMDRKKASLEATCSHLMTKLFLTICSSKVASVLSQMTLWFSNVPGPREEISCCGYPVAFIAPTLYGQPIALVIHVTSYGDKMTFVLSVDDTIIPDPLKLLDDFEESLKLIKNAVIAKQLAKKKVEVGGQLQLSPSI